MPGQEQPCALRALTSTDDQDEGCLALPCVCDLERGTERIERERRARASYQPLPAVSWASEHR